MGSLMQITLLNVLRERWVLKMRRMAGASCADSCIAEVRIWKYVCKCWKFSLAWEILLFGNRLEVKSTLPGGSWENMGSFRIRIVKCIKHGWCGVFLVLIFISLMDRLKNLDWTSKNKHMHDERCVRKRHFFLFFFNKFRYLQKPRREGANVHVSNIYSWIVVEPTKV